MINDVVQQHMLINTPLKHVLQSAEITMALLNKLILTNCRVLKVIPSSSGGVSAGTEVVRRVLCVGRDRFFRVEPLAGGKDLKAAAEPELSLLCGLGGWAHQHPLSAVTPSRSAGHCDFDYCEEMGFHWR